MAAAKLQGGRTRFATGRRLAAAVVAGQRIAEARRLAVGRRFGCPAAGRLSGATGGWTEWRLDSRMAPDSN
jgi:hypothetical protein